MWRLWMALALGSTGAHAGGGLGPAPPSSSKGSCVTYKDAHDDAHGDHHDDGHHRFLASAPPADDGKKVKCDVKEENCDGVWHPPGYVSNATGCCHCGGSCNHDDEWGPPEADSCDDCRRRLADGEAGAECHRRLASADCMCDDCRRRLAGGEDVSADCHRRLADDACADPHRRLAGGGGEATCAYYDAPSGVSYGSCHHACHFCEKRACQRFWLEDSRAGRQGPGKSGRIETVFYEGLVVLALLCITLAFEVLHHHVHHWTGNLQSSSGWMEHVTGEHEHKPHEHHHAVHPKDFVTCFTWNEWHPHFARQLLDQFKWEITVLGFLALIVFACHQLPVFDAIALGRDAKWGAQTHGQVFIAVEMAHFALFAAVCVYFVSLAIVLTLAEKLVSGDAQQERALALERARARPADAEAVAPHGQSVAALEAVLERNGGPPAPGPLDSYRLVRHGVLDFLRHRGLPAHLPHLRLDDGPGSFDDEFHFALYLRAHFEALVVELIEVKPITWLSFMALLACFIGLARSRVLGEWTSFAPGILATAFQVFAFAFSRYRVKKFERKSARRLAKSRAAAEKHRATADDGDLDEAHTAERDHKGKRTRARFSGEAETFMIHIYQAFLLLAMFFVGSVVVNSDSYGCPHDEKCYKKMRNEDWGIVVLTVVTFLALGPPTIYYINIMLRVPPFIDDDDYDVIKMITVMTALRYYDKDGNGTLDADEVKAVVRKLDDSLTDAEVEDLVRSADKDGDGSIDYHEFCAIMLKEAPADFEPAPKADDYAHQAKVIHTLPKDAPREEEKH